MLAKQCLLGVSSEPFAFSVFLAMVAVTCFLAATVGSSVLGLMPDSLKGTVARDF
jgi:hypothetical protein